MKLQAHVEGDNVVIKIDSFEHLLNCLANQKFMPISVNQCWIDIEDQNSIDDTWRQGMDLLNSATLDARVYRGEVASEPDPRPSFKQALTTLINQYSKENGSDTPDFILAKYLTDTLKAFDKATNRRSEWYGDLNEHMMSNEIEGCKIMEPFDLSGEDNTSTTLSTPFNINITVTQ